MRSILLCGIKPDLKTEKENLCVSVRDQISLGIFDYNQLNNYETYLQPDILPWLQSYENII